MVDVDRLRPAPLQRLRLVGLVAPVVFVAILLTARPLLIERFGLPNAHAMLGSTLILSAAVFGWVMYHLLGHAHGVVVECEKRQAALVERERIARELHDSLAQVLGVVHLRLHAASARPGVRTDERTHAEMLELAGLCHEAYRDVREAILGLRDAAHAERTLVEHLDSYVAAFSRISSIPTTLVLDAPNDLRLTPAAEVQIIRVIQEALTNVRKHSGARTATVRITAREDHTEFVISDDGSGFDPSRTHTDGYGLLAMRERAESVAGHFAIDTGPGRGTRVIVQLPGRLPTALSPKQVSA